MLEFVFCVFTFLGSNLGVGSHILPLTGGRGREANAESCFALGVGGCQILALEFYIVPLGQRDEKPEC